MTAITKSIYINQLPEIVKKYNNTTHTSNHMKPGNVSSNT